ncbi:hypothetical protein R6L23_01840 [Streptomyces sp. SR27]|uniref:hypothetical protein n=1 Tax=Streptomyces sp. SR27 TaxID=3076630 RepID=UPI00295BE725|nr:hypothetical protein [Streptomyces sp. SR27]MDV9186976.1 hypothetical protein [Streptomyces sp. SR27]
MIESEHSRGKTRTVGVKVLAAVLAVAAAGGAVWFGLAGDTASGDDLGDSCRGSLAVEEARTFFAGAELEARGHTGEWVGYDTEWCSVTARGQDSGPTLRLQIRPAAAHRASGAAEEASATPVGYGWNGSFVGRRRPEAAVLVDCAALPGKGLLVLTEAMAEVEDLTQEQLLQVARLATETARNTAGRFHCEGALGTRPSEVDLSEWREVPPARASGTCKGAVNAATLTRLGVTAVSEKPAGRALTEACALKRGEKALAELTAYYGPSAEQEMYLDGRYPGSVEGATTRTLTCKGALGTAYVKLIRPSGGKDGRRDLGPADVQELLGSFAAASTARHGCPV